jgi:hypothetical protein
MKTFTAALLLAGMIVAAAGTPAACAPWAGVDETVIEKFAEAAGRPARDPFINTDQGDLLLFVFLLAGIAGGFTAGYYFRTLFPPQGRGRDRAGKGMPQGPAPSRGISAAAGGETPFGNAAPRQ